MASAKPELTRDGTMQVTAKEGVDYLKAAGKDTLLAMQGLVEPEKPALPKDTTMVATAKEGLDFIERCNDKASKEAENDMDSGAAADEGAAAAKNEAVAEKPAIVQDNTMEAPVKEGLDNCNNQKPSSSTAVVNLSPEKTSITKEGTMETTSKEGQALLANANLDPDALTRGQQKQIDAIEEEEEEEEAEKEEEEEPPVKKSKLSKATTMVNTAKEAKTLLGDKAPDADAMTRGQQKKIEDIQAEKPSPKKPKLSKNTTMVATAKEGSALLGKEKLGETRNETKAKSTPSGPKRSRTIMQTMEEAKALLNTDNLDASEGRRTRSSSRPKPPLKKAGTMQATAKEGKEFLKRSKKSKKAAKKAEEEEEEEEEEVMAEEEEA